MSILDGQRAIDGRIQDQHYLDLQRRDAATTLELGYFAGNIRCLYEEALAPDDLGPENA
jgi:hypothetical protein